MKKILFIMPLMAMSLLACNKSNPYKIDEENFFKSISYEGIEYLQCDGVDKNGPFIAMYSPSTYCYVDADRGGYTDYYIKKDGDSYIGFERGIYGWKEMASEDAKEKFRTPSTDKKINTIHYFEEYEFSYQDFEYQVETKTYDYMDYLSYKFKNKKLVHFKTSDDGWEFDLTYDEVEPESPVPSYLIIN